jgi:mRNA-degrading endonuclease RelE of RelBE toxin-antitoxin system
VIHIEEEGFLKQLAKMPGHVQESLRRKQKFMSDNPRGPWPNVEQKYDSRRGRHRPGSYAARIASGYRAVFTRDGDAITWYWISTHSDYDNFLR